MISNGLMVFLMSQYAIIALFGIFEQNYNRSLYFLGALLISVAVIRMR